MLGTMPLRKRFLNVSVGFRNQSVQVTLVENGDLWKIDTVGRSGPSASGRGFPQDRRIFQTFDTAEEAAEFVAELIRRGIILPGEGFAGGIEQFHFDE